MSASLALQYVAVGLAVLISAIVVFQKQWPHAARRLRVAVALPLLRAGQPALLQAMGRSIAPPPRVDTGECGGCNNCGSSNTPASAE